MLSVCGERKGRNEKDKYYVAAQNLEPNTEIKYTFQKDEEGNDENGLISSQTVEEILLYVKEVGNTDDTEITLTPIQTAPDAYIIRSCFLLSAADFFRAVKIPFSPLLFRALGRIPVGRYADGQIIQLLLINRSRCLHHQTGCILHFRECNDVTNTFLF